MAAGRRSKTNKASKATAPHLSIDLCLDPDSAAPMHRQLFDGLKKAIVEVRLMPGQLLPSTRDLAEQLGISRTTVVRGYEDLLNQGYLKSVDGVGTFVSQVLPGQRPRVRQAPTNSPVRLSQYAQRLMTVLPAPLTSADQPFLHFGASPSEQLPSRQWRQVLLKHCREHDPASFDYDAEPFGHKPLRQAIADYLGRTRALQCSVSQVGVFAGTLDAPNLVAQLLVDPGDLVAVEEPGFTFMRHRFLSLGATLVPVPVDQDGIVVEELQKAETAKIVYVTPSHQDPTGAVLSLSRRKALLSWARQTGAIIVEDDYDSEYRYTGSQLPSLQGMDEYDRVIYLSSFWKTLFPIVSGGYLVVPESFVSVFSHAIYMREGAVNTSFPMLEQDALTEFIDEGMLERHIRKTQPIYARRWQALVAALTLHLRPHLTLTKESAAMHLVVRFHVPLEDDVIVTLAQQARFALISTACYYAGAAAPGEFLIPFAHLQEDELKRSVNDFAQLLEERLAQPSLND